MKVIDGKNAVLGRLASYVAKELLKGEKIVILNCEEVMITGNRKKIEENFRQKRERVGSGQRGPKHSRDNEKIVKRTIRGMLPNTRKSGRGRDAHKRVKCYNQIPEEFQDVKKISLDLKKVNKFIRIKNLPK